MSRAKPNDPTTPKAATPQLAQGPFNLRETALPCLALVCVLASMTAMNTLVFPHFDTMFSPARDLSVLVNAAALAATGLIAGYKPRFATSRILEVATVSCLAAGGITLAAGAALPSATLLTLGACVEAVGRAGIILLSGLALCALSPTRASLAICLAYLAQYLLVPVVRVLPTAGGFALFIVAPFIAFVLCRTQARAVVGKEPPATSPLDLSVTRPASFIAPMSTLYVCLFLFHIAFGWSLRFSEVAGVPTGELLGLVPIAIIAIYLAVSKKTMPADLLTQLSVLVVVAGFLLAASGYAAYHATANALLSCGNAVFDMVALVVLVSVASRNPLGAITVIAWGKGISGLGTILGAFLGVSMNHAMENNPPLLFATSGALLLVFVGWALIGLKDFSFRAAIEGIEPVDADKPTPAAVSATAEPVNVFDERCEQIGREHGLTPRELEIFRMLARGRNREYIQEELVVSRKTVKAHVKHIYAKLDIHSHQELLDLVE